MADGDDDEAVEGTDIVAGDVVLVMMGKVCMMMVVVTSN